MLLNTLGSLQKLVVIKNDEKKNGKRSPNSLATFNSFRETSNEE